jgi:predicted acyltransferase
MTTSSSQRSISLDVFRGLTVCFMIIVNTPGAGVTPYAPLNHAQWHGFTPTDLVFPSFLFAVGNAMSFSMARITGHAVFLQKVIKRSLLIFILGFLMYWYPFFEADSTGHWQFSPFANTRIMGVLQRIALCYFFAALLARYLSARALVIACILFLIGYWIILLAFAANDDPYAMLSNAGTLLDKYVLGDSHLYHGEGVAFDPEGLLSTLPATVNVIMGYFAGKYLKEKGRVYKSVAELMLAGFALVLLALVWNYYFPINKKIWSSSFVLLTSGLDLMILPALVYVLDLREWNGWNWTRFFLVFGRNPLFIYLLSELLFITFYRIIMRSGESFYQWINRVLFQALFPGPAGSLLYALLFMLVCWLAGWWLDRAKIYIKV